MKDLDPEVRADLARMRESESDSTREPIRLGPSESVVSWRCRNRACPDGRPMISVGAWAITSLETMNRELAKRHERPITEDDIMLCPTCKRVIDEELRRRRDRDDAAVAALMREARKPLGELRRREVVEALKALGVSDAETCVRSSSERAGGRL